MSSFIDISMIGDKKTQKAFKKMEIKMQGKVFRKAVRDAAEPVLALAKMYTPVDTGKTRDSLKIRAGTGKRGTIGVRIQTGTRKELGIAPDEKFFYPAVVEYNHQSYLRRAIDNDPGSVRNHVARVIKASI